MWKKFRPVVRGLYRLLGALNGFFYDYSRFLRNGGWPGSMDEKGQRDYALVMLYHGLEKSLSYKSRNPDSGWKNAFEALTLIEKAYVLGELGRVDEVAINALEKFIGLPENKDTSRALLIRERLKVIDYKRVDGAGVINLASSEFLKGILKDPEGFFNSRYSLREFKEEAVDKELIGRAVRLAMKTPSVCNRQAWAVYHSADQKVKDVVLDHQNGNKPFGKKIPNLLVVTADLKAFFTGNERYQHWIDGGLFSMSLIYALHSLGVGSCPLNWSQSPSVDKSLRMLLDIDSAHTIIMVVAVGYPDEWNKVCVSARRPLDDVFYELKLRNENSTSHNS